VTDRDRVVDGIVTGSHVRTASGSRPRLAPVLARRGYVCAWETGPRPLPPPSGLLRWGRAAVLPISSVAGVATSDPVAALTFDDGPDPATTPAVLDALARHGATATFFVLAERAQQHPELVRRARAEGHEVGLHGDDHTRLSAVPPSEAVRRIRRGRRRLERVLQEPVSLYRPAYGAQRLGQLLGTRLLGLDVVLWTAWARDWEPAHAPAVADRALAALHPGAFLLLHDTVGDAAPVDGGSHPAGPAVDRAEMTDAVLTGMAAAGIATATVGQLLATYPAVRTPWFARD
jgi:peptidoglycan/xylan/chitin deacetylase (PgdA/CDA1 family)